MSILRATPRFISLLVLVSLLLGGCGFFGQSDAPAEESGDITTFNAIPKSDDDNVDETIEEAPGKASPVEASPVNCFERHVIRGLLEKSSDASGIPSINVIVIVNAWLVTLVP